MNKTNVYKYSTALYIKKTDVMYAKPMHISSKVESFPNKYTLGGVSPIIPPGAFMQNAIACWAALFFLSKWSLPLPFSLWTREEQFKNLFFFYKPQLTPAQLDYLGLITHTIQSDGDWSTTLAKSQPPIPSQRAINQSVSLRQAVRVGTMPQMFSSSFNFFLSFFIFLLLLLLQLGVVA